MYYVYVIKSLKDNRLYKGMSQNVQKRLSQHNRREDKSTKAYRPWELLLVKEFGERLEARNFEKYLKTGIGRDFLKTLK